MTTGSNASRARRTSSPCGAGERNQTANMAMSSTIAMSSIPCAASRWRCLIWSIAPTLPPPRLRPCVRRLARRTRREIRLPRHGRPSGARTRTHLRGGTRRCAASRSRRRHPPEPQGAHRTLPPEGHGIAGRRRHAALARHLRPDRRDRGRSRMNATAKIDAARIELLLGELRLPGIKLIWTALAETADKEGWPAARCLAALAEQEMVERSRRRFERHLEEARLPPGKTDDGNV